MFNLAIQLSIHISKKLVSGGF